MHHHHCSHEESECRHEHGEYCHGDHHGHSCCEHEHDGEESGCEMEVFFCLAKKAWKKLMVEKIKAEMERMEGEKLNRLAKLIAETKVKKFHAKMEKKKALHEFQSQLGDLMCNK